MTTSSQTPPGALPPEASQQPNVVPLAQAAFATFGIAVPAPAGPAAEAASGVTVAEAAAAVLDARIAEDGGATAEQLAEAERNAGLLFDAASVEAAVAAARDQARAEIRAELAEAEQQLAVMAGAYRRVQAVMRLCEGRRGDDLLLVSAVAVAAECGSTALDGLPMTLTWDRSAEIPAAADPVKRVIVDCLSSYGGRAALVLEGDERSALASLLDAEVRDIHAPCATDGCGTLDDYDASDPAMFGWARVEVAGIEGEPRWYCSPQCVSAALARAGEELAVIDEMAATDPDDHVPYLLAQDEARCVRCGCTEDAACEGGCRWAPNRHMVDICSSCVKPEDLVDEAVPGE
ncbi:hypothetical protein [Streptomyces sp. NRRL S-146]|uniref:hypothetical protein n=1 Tax=Streptomyces sp. NRRL S-146 TaxID=1463884 RepID=UPI00131BA545|nr:hypothetical protein [Streptomyces sp. NRRL S-146]